MRPCSVYCPRQLNQRDRENARLVDSQPWDVRVCTGTYIPSLTCPTQIGRSRIRRSTLHLSLSLSYLGHEMPSHESVLESLRDEQRLKVCLCLRPSGTQAIRHHDLNKNPLGSNSSSSALNIVEVSNKEGRGYRNWTQRENTRYRNRLFENRLLFPVLPTQAYPSLT